MENIDLEGRLAELEKVVGELTKVVYSHAFAVASLRYEFGMHLMSTTDRPFLTC